MRTNSRAVRAAGHDRAGTHDEIGPLIADEATSMLDASLRVDVLKDLRDQLGMTVLFITHDIGQACYLADRVLVMEHGVMVEQGKTDEVIFNPQARIHQTAARRCTEAARGDRTPRSAGRATEGGRADLNLIRC
jgi:ABC-type glutathione transport system ATPase component